MILAFGSSAFLPLTSGSGGAVGVIDSGPWWPLFNNDAKDSVILNNYHNDYHNNNNNNSGAAAMVVTEEYFTQHRHFGGAVGGGVSVGGGGGGGHRHVYPHHHFHQNERHLSHHQMSVVAAAASSAADSAMLSDDDEKDGNGGALASGIIADRSGGVAAATSCLALVNLLVVCGNVFVLYILISQKSLHTSTNFIVLSLTLSDFLLGILILPFSILQEYSLTWMFGEVWCRLWLALDVLLSTASIYNLLAISFDRYMAVRQPIKYRLISSNRMTKITIAVVWLIASALALPPLIFDHFKITGATPIPSAAADTYSAFVPLSGGASHAAPMSGGQCTPVTSSDWYILFSAFISFILPMFLMIALNFSIFYTVSDSTKLTKVPTTTSTSASKNFTTTIAASCDDVNSLLRIHRGTGRTAGVRNGFARNGAFNGSQRSLSLIKKVSMANYEMYRNGYSVDQAHPLHHHHYQHPPSLPATRKATFDYASSTPAAAISASPRNSSLAESLTGRGASIDSTMTAPPNAANSAAAMATPATASSELRVTDDTFSTSLDSVSMNAGNGGAEFTNGTGTNSSYHAYYHHYHHPSTALKGAKLTWINRIKAINMEKRRQNLVDPEGNSIHSNASSTLQCSASPVPLDVAAPRNSSTPTPSIASSSNNNNNNNNNSENNKVQRYVKMDQTSIGSAESGVIVTSSKVHHQEQSAINTSIATNTTTATSTSSSSSSSQTVAMHPSGCGTTVAQPPPQPPLVAEKPLLVDQGVWYPASLVTTLLASGYTAVANSTTSSVYDGNSVCSRKTTKQHSFGGGGLFLYPVFPPHPQQLSRSSLRTELRVARTIGVVVGCFTACWLPFTIIYVLQAFQTCPVGTCVPDWFFTLAFWLGYANSALNPLLYAAFSRDFRSAFRRVLMDRGSSFRSTQ